MTKAQCKNLLVSQNKGILAVVLNRPKVLNAFNSEMAAELREVFEKARRDSSVRCLLLSGEGKAFCAGQDLGEITVDDPVTPPDLGKLLLEVYNPLLKSLFEFEKPIVCAVQGTAAGAGMSLALACDFVIASENAQFIASFSNVGLIPDSGLSFVLPRLVGMTRSREILMLGEKIPAKSALEFSLITRVVSEQTLKESAETLAEQLSRRATLALGLTKRALRYSAENSISEQLQLEADLQRHAGLSADFREGVLAFRGKRKPNFSGR